MKRTASVLHLDDLRLVQKIRRGDEVAFRQVFDEYYDRLYRFALARLNRDESAAEDVVQQALSRAIQSLPSYRGEAQLQTWLFTICRNSIIDWQRRKGVRENAVVLAEDSPGIRAEVESFAAPDRDDPLISTQNSETSRLVHVALDRIPKHYGDALEWKYIQGWSIKEISSELGIGADATQSLLARAKKAFAEVYSALPNDRPSLVR